MSNKGNLIVISAPSGSGKTSLANRALEEIPKLKFSVSHTTRKPRPGERDQVEYFFVSEKEFEEMIGKDTFLEHARVYGNYYGTSQAFVDEQLSVGYDVLLDLDVQGAAQVKKSYPEAVLVFVFPPSLEVLKTRLKNRGLDDPSIIDERLRIAKKEIRYYTDYQYVIINRKIEESLVELKSIIEASGCRLEKRKELAAEIIKTFPGD
jgi:guanylate kinase